MKIVVDENMPKVAELFADIADVSYVNGRTVNACDLKGADALLVRSVTKVNSTLLDGTDIKFVGTATIGVDHIDQDYLAENKIGFASAPGCNANAVADYVLSALSYLYLHKGVSWLKAKVGIVGFGNVGKRVYTRLKALGCDLVVYDPFQSQLANLDGVSFNNLESVMACDVICLHAPLTQAGEFPTKGMIDESLLAQLKPGASIVSAGRGGVLHEKSLLKRYNELNGDLNLVLDVWAGEPNIDKELMALADIATPHIAGYSLQGREKGTLMVYQAFCQHFGLDAAFDEHNGLSRGALASIEFAPQHDEHLLIAHACHAIYNLAADDSKMRQLMSRSHVGGEFDYLRKHYVERDEFSTCQVAKEYVDLLALGFSKKV